MSNRPTPRPQPPNPTKATPQAPTAPENGTQDLPELVQDATEPKDRYKELGKVVRRTQQKRYVLCNHKDEAGIKKFVAEEKLERYLHPVVVEGQNVGKVLVLRQEIVITLKD